MNPRTRLVATLKEKENGPLLEGRKSRAWEGAGTEGQKQKA